ncbi:MAG: F0F1 ATP synthase subunit epsilon [Clostridia bacterium]|nr:F0F1 ATP synthase subunit epsilon [Clostridia bacterium]MBR0509265.1 F0F1 ATP synthase subunit epsilon [Clostridia bacterium]MBR0537680.1 F0F1 ATP synthase subunit epsilon [Clostridia bacterium]
MMQLKIYTPAMLALDREIESLVFQGEKGETCILRHHTAAVFAVHEGTVRVKGTDGNVVKYAVDDGFLRVQNDRIDLFCGVLDPV